MKNKKSAEVDGLSQDKLVLGSKALAGPLLEIINKSIQDSCFPTEWKEALVTPVLKKGDPLKMTKKQLCITTMTNLNV